MAIKINTAYKEILTSAMLNEKVAGVVGGNEKVSGFDVSIRTSTSVAITPGRAYVNGCSIEETLNTRTVSLDRDMLSDDGVVYIVLVYAHETNSVEFSCSKQINPNMVKLATLVINNGAIAELVNHEGVSTLNTVVGEAADLEAQKIRDSIPSGFITLGQLDYEYMSNNENSVKIKQESIAYVNGYRIEIPANTVVNIGKAPEKEPREDLLFLEAWKDSDFAKNGKLKWRIRHVPDIDFDKKWVQANEGPDKYIGLNSDGSEFAKIIPQGGRATVPTHCSWNRVYQNRCTADYISASGMVNPTHGDPGLWSYFFWTKNELDTLKNEMQTADGLAYAIPMFRLYRKPSCGKSIPFEYSKINQKVNYSKFTKLMGEDKVERSTAEHIQGRSLINLVEYKNDNNATVITAGMAYTVNISSLKDNTPYTIFINFVDEVPHKNFRLVRPETFGAINYYVPSKTRGLYKTVITTDSAAASEWNNGRTNLYNFGNANITIDKYMVLEGDYSNIDIDPFTGMKSLGEDDGNLITVKNGILHDDTYDANDGILTLTAFPDVTHVDSTNLITPSIEAIVKKGEQQTPLEKLEAKLETDGTEIIEFTKIKGRTLQNVITEYSGSSEVYSISNGLITVDASIGQSYRFYGPLNNGMLKPNKKYTLVIDIIQNTLNGTQVEINYPQLNGTSHGTCISDSIFLPFGSIGKIIKVVTTKEDIANQRYLFAPRLTPGQTSGVLKIRFMLLEQDHTNTPVEALPFIEGIQSVGENEVTENQKYKINVTSYGKNLINVNNLTRGYIGAEGTEYTSGPNNALAPYVKIKPDTDYIGYSEGVSKLHNYSWYGINRDFIKRDSGVGSKRSPSNAHHLRYHNHYVDNNKIVDLTDVKIQVSEGTSIDRYEAHQKFTQEVYLNEPLRSLPSGVCDEIVGSKIIRRVGKYTFDGSEPFGIAATETDASEGFTTAYVYKLNSNIKGGGGFICDRFKYYGYDPHFRIHKNEESCSDGGGYKRQYFRIANSRLSSPDLSGFKTWLAQHPTTIYYELEYPIEEPLEHVYEKESIKTYQLDAPLRSLPNGVKDEIKDGILIRRCKELIFDGSTDESWEYPTNQGTNDITSLFTIRVPDAVTASGNEAHAMCDKFTDSVNDLWTQDKACVWLNSNLKLNIRVQNARIGSKTVNAFKTWLRANPIKVIYQLATPIEIPLTEAKAQHSSFSLRRQFSEGNWLRELPNGVKDTIENGKVIRRVGKIDLNKNETWGHYIDWGITDVNTSAFVYIKNDLNCIDISPRHKDYKDAFINNTSIKTGNPYASDIECICCHVNQIRVRINKSKLSDDNVAGFKAWLAKNPITILYELATPVEEPLNDYSNHMLYPSHDFNTYCGSIYVGEGRNYIATENTMPTKNPVAIKTEFRTITGKARVEDCRYKKHDDGYSTMLKVSRSKNLFDINYVKEALANVRGVIPLNEGIKLDLGANSNVANDVHSILGNFMQKQFKPKTSYICKINGYSNDSNSKFNAGWQVNYSDGSYTLIRGSVVITPPEKDVVSVRLGWYTQAHGGWTTLDEFQIEENVNGQASPYTPCESSSRAFENIEENDIEDLRHQVSLTGFNYDKILSESFDKLLRGEL